MDEAGRRTIEGKEQGAGSRQFGMVGGAPAAVALSHALNPTYTIHPKPKTLKSSGLDTNGKCGEADRPRAGLCLHETCVHVVTSSEHCPAAVLRWQDKRGQ